MLTIKIKTGNAAFHDDEGNFRPGPELARIVQNLVYRLRSPEYVGTETGVLMDVNGNRVGDWRLTNR